MANYYCTARSNYFKVKDIKAFDEWCKVFNVEKIDKEDKVGFLCNSDDPLPSCRWNEETDEWEEADALEALAPMLEDQEVGIYMEAGAEKYRYIFSIAVAFNNQGKFASVTLDDIYRKARKLGTNVTEVLY